MDSADKTAIIVILNGRRGPHIRTLIELALNGIIFPDLFYQDSVIHLSGETKIDDMREQIESERLPKDQYAQCSR